MKRDSLNSGFTLVELMVVVAMVAILGVLIGPSLMGSQGARGAKAAACAIAGNIRQARLLAQRDCRPYFVQFMDQSVPLDNGDGLHLDCIMWRDLVGGTLSNLDATDADGNGIPDEIVGQAALFGNTAVTPPYGNACKGVVFGSMGVNGPVGGPPGVLAAGGPVSFTPYPSGIANQTIRISPEGNCSSGRVYISDYTLSAPGVPAPCRVCYCVQVSSSGAVRIWRWTQSQPTWGML
ncbi:MAG: prepilin-type N-terminal cleavage/methylation domain-containing protein [Pseudomonadota bacterium]